MTFITNHESSELRHHKLMYDLDEVVVPNLNYSMLDPESAEKNFFELAAQPSVRSQVRIFRHMAGQVDRVLDQTYTDPGVQSVLRHGQFDLLLLSQIVSYAGYPLAWHFNCPFILTSPNVLMTDSAYLMGDSEHTVSRVQYPFANLIKKIDCDEIGAGIRPFLPDENDGSYDSDAACNQHGYHAFT